MLAAVAKENWVMAPACQRGDPSSRTAQNTPAFAPVWRNSRSPAENATLRESAGVHCLRSSPSASPDSHVGSSPMKHSRRPSLVSRAHVDLVRVASAMCPGH
ncbi:putative leader peptide [Tessaracoccus terricola]